MKSISEDNLNHIPIDKKTKFLQFQYAFVSFKESQSAEIAVGRQPYYRIQDEQFNKELDVLLEQVKVIKDLEEK